MTKHNSVFDKLHEIVKDSFSDLREIDQLYILNELYRTHLYFRIKYLYSKKLIEENGTQRTIFLKGLQEASKTHYKSIGKQDEDGCFCYY